MTRSWCHELVTRSIDILGAIAALIVLLPFLPLVALAVALDSRGPIFYGARRVGRDGRLFSMWKFRTMVSDADNIPGNINVSDTDRRLTRVGLFLRQTKINEFPQFLNVLMGDMSLVGPRPEIEHYVSLYTDEEREILTVRPGLLDWATLRFSDMGALLASCDKPDQLYEHDVRPRIIQLQLDYIRTRSVALDLRILTSAVWQLVLSPVLRRVLPLGRPGIAPVTRRWPIRPSSALRGLSNIRPRRSGNLLDNVQSQGRSHR